MGTIQPKGIKGQSEPLIFFAKPLPVGFTAPSD